MTLICSPFCTNHFMVGMSRLSALSMFSLVMVSPGWTSAVAQPATVRLTAPTAMIAQAALIQRRNCIPYPPLQVRIITGLLSAALADGAMEGPDGGARGIRIALLPAGFFRR